MAKLVLSERVTRLTGRSKAFNDTILIRVMNAGMKQLRDLIKTRFMGGAKTTARRLARNTGKMEQRTVARRAERTGIGVRGSIAINVPYASVHFGVRGHETIITPKVKQALTVPMRGVLGPDKRPVLPANSRQIKGKHVKNGIAYGILPGDVMKPLFKLKSSVAVPVRVDIQRDIEPVAERIMQKLIRDELIKVMNG